VLWGETSSQIKVYVYGTADPVQFSSARMSEMYFFVFQQSYLGRV